MSVTEFDLRREGDTFAYVWGRLGYAITFDCLVEERYGLRGEIRVETSSVSEQTGRPGHLYQARYNLSDGPERDKVAKVLSARDERVPWRDMLEVACVTTLRAFREGAALSDLSRTVPTPQRYLDTLGIVPVGETSVLYGDGASCKSFVALAYALAVRTGCSVGPFEPTEQCGVLVLDWETTEDEQAERLHRLCMGLGIRNVPAFHYRPMWRPLAEDQTAVRRLVGECGATLVLVDSIAPAMGGEVGSEQAIPFFNALRSLGPGVTRLVVSHVSKADAHQQTGPGDPYGSVFVRNLSRSAWAAKATPDGDGLGVEVGLFHTKANRGPLRRPVGVRFEFEDPAGPVTLRRVDVLDNPELVQHASLGDRIYAALREGSLSTDEIVERTGATKASVLRTLLRRRDEIVRLTGGPGRGNTATWGLAFQRQEG